MPAGLVALRGPTLSCTRKRGSTDFAENVVYEPDTLILLKEGNIIDFGPTKKLRNRISSDTKVELLDRCRIIKTVIP